MIRSDGEPTRLETSAIVFSHGVPPPRQLIVDNAVFAPALLFLFAHFFRLSFVTALQCYFVHSSVFNSDAAQATFFVFAHFRFLHFHRLAILFRSLILSAPFPFSPPCSIELFAHFFSLPSALTFLLLFCRSFSFSPFSLTCSIV